MTTRVHLLAIVAATAWLVAALVTAETPGPTLASAQEPDAASPTMADCLACHDDLEANLGSHGALAPSQLAAAGTDNTCTACHGDPTEHLANDGEILAFRDEDSPLLKTQQCMACHVQSHPRFTASAHAIAGQDCASCHSVHTAPEPARGGPWSLLDRDSAACAECHADVLSEFSFNERHRLEEGALECSSCHDPHEPSVRVQLGGFKSQDCVTCHTDKGGPFVFEHGASVVEGCVACHAPHGSPNRHMLTFQRVAEQCYSCHNVVPGFHARFDLDNQCTECHSTIHGSNFDPFFLK